MSFPRRFRRLARRGLRRTLGGPRFDAWVDARVPYRAGALEQAEGPIVFVEPHFDDVAFSCGGTLARLTAAGMPVHVVTVFTKGPTGPLSPLAQQLHAAWGTTGDPYAPRRAEGQAFLDATGAAGTWLGLPEALYRHDDWTATDDLFRADAPPEADPAFPAVRQALADALPAWGACTVVAPLGIGNHADHLVVHAAVRALPTDGRTVWFYEDYPYATNREHARTRRAAVAPAAMTAVDVSDTLDARMAMCRLYPSQFASIFQTDARMRDRLTAYATAVGTPGRPAERFWGRCRAGAPAVDASAVDASAPHASSTSQSAPA